MNYPKLKGIKKTYFGYEDIARALGIRLKSARVSANRYVRGGFLVRVKRNIYVFKERWQAFSREEKFAIANLIQAPSYVSLMSALEYYEVTTEMQRDFIESIALKRTKKTDVEGAIFAYTKIDRRLYFGFSRDKGFFIATPEKAFLDAVYLLSLKRYNFDIASIDFRKLNIPKMKMMARSLPVKTRRMLERNGYFAKA